VQGLIKGYGAFYVGSCLLYSINVWFGDKNAIAWSF